LNVWPSIDGHTFNSVNLMLVKAYGKPAQSRGRGAQMPEAEGDLTSRKGRCDGRAVRGA